MQQREREMVIKVQDAAFVQGNMIRNASNATDASTTDASDAAQELPIPSAPAVPTASYGHKLQLQEWDSKRFIKTLQDQDLPNDCRQIECYVDSWTRSPLAVKRFPRKSLENMSASDERELENPWTELLIGLWLSQRSTASHQFAYRCFGAFMDVNGDGLLAMERLQGGDLFDYVASLGTPGPQREAIIIPVVMSIFTAVSSLHNQGLAHGDISVENIMFRGAQGASDVVFVDFGMAIIGRLATTSFGLRGKVMYRAPEILHSHCYDAFAADLFALGIVVYSLAIGRYPWRSTVPGACKCYDYVRSHGLYRFMQKRIVPATGGRTVADCMSGNFQRLVGMLLSDEPQRRYKAISLLLGYAF